MTQYGGIAKLYRQSSRGFFTETTSDARLLCTRFHYGQLIDVTGDGRVDFLCSDEELFPQKIYDTLPFPWKKVYDNTRPAPYLPAVPQSPTPSSVTSTTTAAWTCSCWAACSCGPHGVEQGSATHSSRNLTGGNKGVRFVTTARSR